MFLFCQIGVARQQLFGRVPRALVERLIAERIGDPKRRYAALPLSEQVAHSAETQILTRDLEAVFRSNEDLQSFGDIRTHVAQKNAIRLIRAASDPAAQLM